MNDLNICISSAGRRVELANTILSDAQALGLAARIVAADSAPEFSAACHSAAACLAVPRCTDPDYIDKILAICHAQKIKIFIPTIDNELLVLSEASSRFREAGVHLVVSSDEAIKVARNKLLTAQTLARLAIPSPRTASLDDLLSGRTKLSMPLILKPVDGSSSIGIRFANDSSELKSFNLKSERYIAQERLEGVEYTVNCFVDEQGSLRAAIPHRRIETRGGEVSKGMTERREDLQKLAEQVVQAVPGLRGPFCFQLILTSDGPKVFEINARFGGGYPLAHAAGATFGKWIIEEALGRPSSANNEWQTGLLMLRYDAAVFIPPK